MTADMDPAHRQLLRENRTRIVEDIADLGMVVDKLIEKGIISDSMAQDVIQGQNTNLNKARKLLDILPKRGPDAFKSFCMSLMDTEQSSLAQLLDPQIVAYLPIDSNRGPGKSRGQSGPPVPYVPPPKPVPINPAARYTPPSGQGSSYPSSSGQSQSTKYSPTTQPGTIGEPSLIKPQPTIGIQGVQPSSVGMSRQQSRDITVYTPSEEASSDFFPEDWPSSVENSPFSRKNYKMLPFLHEKIQEIMTMNIYEMSKKVRGFAILVNMTKSGNDQREERSLSDNDITRLSMVFKDLGFKNLPESNSTAESLRDFLKKIAGKVIPGHQCFILTISSYGGDNTVVCADGNEVPIQEILDFFSEKNCPALIGKPKLFFIQACGVKMKDVEVPSEEELSQSIRTGLRRLSLADIPDCDERDTIPDEFTSTDMKDTLVAMATSPDFKDDKQKYNSVFLLGLAYVLCQCAKDTEIVNIMKYINKLKKNSRTGNYETLCEYRSSLVKKLYFLPGHQSVSG